MVIRHQSFAANTTGSTLAGSIGQGLSSGHTSGTIPASSADGMGRELPVLIAEDEVQIAVVVAALMNDLGYYPRIASNGRQALAMARAAWPRLVITDLMMPELSGAELIAALRAETEAGGRPPLAVILMTAGGSPQRGYTAGADAVIAKPFDLDELEAVVVRLLSDAA